MTKSLLSILSCVLAIVTMTSCATQLVQERANLPFSVAVLPVDLSLKSQAGRDRDGKPLEIELSLNDAQVSEAIVNRFAKEGFTRAILLPFPEDVDRETFFSWSENRQSEWWIDSARKAGADLLLECRLDYSPQIVTSRNDKFWPNFVLFSVGGPFNMLTNDRSYLIETGLRASLFDLNPIYSERAALFDRSSLLVNLQSEATEVALDFVDRAEGAGDYALGLFIPSSFLATENETVRDRVESEVVQTLCQDLSERLTLDSRVVVTADRLVNFFLEPEQVEVVRDPGGGVRINGELVLLRGGDAEGLDEYRLEAGDVVITDTFGSGRLDEERSGRRQQYLRYSLDRHLPVDTSVSFVRLFVWDDSRDRRGRSFTFPIVEPKEE